eukprot:NODE_11931_length_1257_cov_3.199115.p2 GENE.NODE_11931_length_1257_cov_3.199115~~NODE_11931_length_1257_cov_3.199115.p2  ORF type:complete len:84 (+),score=1.62 NODE_11931_length_1257_cov_3.199115:554-805(+)
MRHLITTLAPAAKSTAIINTIRNRVNAQMREHHDAVFAKIVPTTASAAHGCELECWQISKYLQDVKPSLHALCSTALLQQDRS